MATEDLIKINAELEPIAKAEWEINTVMRRTGLCNFGGKKPVWKWDKRHGKLTRGDGKELTGIIMPLISLSLSLFHLLWYAKRIV